MLTKVKSPPRLKDMQLFRQQCYIDGQWVDADDGTMLAVPNPATGEQVGTVPKMGVTETKRAIDAANAALPAWRAKTAKEYLVRLPLDDAARLHALVELFPGQSIEEIITDLLGAGLDEIAAAIPYERGPKVISRDDHGDPVYEDIGLTPRFVELTRKYKKNLECMGEK